jgi:hypothetical protein
MMDEVYDRLSPVLQELYRNIDAQMERERKKPKRAPNGDRRLGPGTPPEGMAERRVNGERRHNLRSPRAKDEGDK